MRYSINFDRTINQLVPYYLGGRKLILFLQSCIKPLKAVNKIFVEWAKETRIEACMTSQVFKLEWFLNRRFSKFFENPFDKIVINNADEIGTTIFSQTALDVPQRGHMTIYYGDESGEEDSPILFRQGEATKSNTHSFFVCCPTLWKDSSSGILKDGLTEDEFVYMIKRQIDRYKISGKTYSITIEK